MIKVTVKVEIKGAPPTTTMSELPLYFIPHAVPLGAPPPKVLVKLLLVWMVKVAIKVGRSYRCCK